MARKAVVRTVAGAVERDLAGIAKRDPALAESALAMSALRLAREMDSSKNSATSKSMCDKGLREAMRELRELAPPEEKPDALNEIEAQRAKRLERVARAAG